MAAHSETEGDALRAGLSPAEQLELVLGWVDAAIAYSRSRRRTFRTASSLVKVATLVLSAASTIVLGVQDLDFWAGMGFSLVALATVAGAIEPFFNWRSRWVLMEEQLHNLYRLGENMRLAVARTTAIETAQVDGFYAEYREIWDSSGRRWLEYRNAAEHR